MKKNITLTACIITKNQQEMIADSIDSVAFADEVLVVDTGSSDITPDIAKKMGARVVSFTKGSFNDWRNEGLKKAKGNWILYVDSDERVTDSLREEILKITGKSVNNQKYSAYAIPRKNIIFGKEFKYGGQYPDYQRRFFLKSKLKRWKGKVHEEPVYEGNLGYLKNSILHQKHNNLADMVSKTNEWSEIEAKLMYEANHPPMNIPRFITAMLREFYSSMIKKKGYKDGPEGVIYAMYQVFSRFVSYAKLWEMQIKAK